MFKYPVLMLVVLENAKYCSALNKIYAVVGTNITLMCPFKSLTKWQGPPNLEYYTHGTLVSPFVKNSKLISVVRNTSDGGFNLQIRNYSSDLEGAYRCISINTNGVPVQRDYELLTTGVGPVMKPILMDCNVSSTITIECAINANDDIQQNVQVNHYFNDKFIRKFNVTKEENRYSLSIPECSFEDMGEYECILNTTKSTISKSIEVVIKGPPIIINHSKIIIGTTTVYSVKFYSEPGIRKKQWSFRSKGGNNIIAGESNMEMAQFKTVVLSKIVNKTKIDFNGFFFSLTVNQNRNTPGKYVCHLSNAFGDIEYSFENSLLHQSVADEKETRYPTVVNDSQMDDKDNIQTEDRRIDAMMYFISGCLLVIVILLVGVILFIHRNYRYTQRQSLNVICSASNREHQLNTLLPDTEACIEVAPQTSMRDTLDTPYYISVIDDEYCLTNVGYEDDDSNYELVDPVNKYESLKSKEPKEHSYNLENIDSSHINNFNIARPVSCQIPNSPYLVLPDVNSLGRYCTDGVSDYILTKRSKTL